MKRVRSLSILLALSLAACESGPREAEALPADGAAPATVPAAPASAAPEIPEDAPVVAVLGDSLAAGLHLASDEAFPARLQELLVDRGQPFELVNAGVSGSTTGGGLDRIDWVLRTEPDVVLIELGANDGFRGVPVDVIEGNLRGIIERVRAAGATPLLVGVALPPNYGAGYVARFNALFARVAEAEGVAFAPRFLEGVGGVPAMNLPDGIHPTPEGHRRLAANLAEPLATVLAELSAARAPATPGAPAS